MPRSNSSCTAAGAAAAATVASDTAGATAPAADAAEGEVVAARASSVASAHVSKGGSKQDTLTVRQENDSLPQEDTRRVRLWLRLWLQLMMLIDVGAVAGDHDLLLKFMVMLMMLHLWPHDGD